VGCADDDALHAIVGGGKLEVTQAADSLLLGRLLETAAAPN
jgi:hypothetical protein